MEEGGDEARGQGQLISGFWVLGSGFLYGNSQEHSELSLSVTTAHLTTQFNGSVKLCRQKKVLEKREKGKSYFQASISSLFQKDDYYYYFSLFFHLSSSFGKQRISLIGSQVILWLQ